MKKFKVTAKKGTVGGLGGRYFKEGEIVSESNFLSGHAKILADKGFLEEVKEPAKEEVKKPTAAQKKAADKK